MPLLLNVLLCSLFQHHNNYLYVKELISMSPSVDEIKTAGENLYIMLFTLMLYRNNTHQLHESANRNLSHWDTDVHQSFNGRPKTAAFICSCAKKQSNMLLSTTHKSKKILTKI